MEMKIRTLPTVTLNKVVIIRYKNSEESLISVCICEERPKDISQDVTYISPQAPVARAILNHIEGEEVDVVTPGGTKGLATSCNHPLPVTPKRFLRGICSA